jgi:DNA-binding NarL/FixJ family response regulator
VIRVLLADDQSLVRAGFKALLDAQSDLEVAGEAADGEEAVRKVRELRPDVVLMDIRMPMLDGLAATRRLTDDPDLKDVKVVMLTTFELDEYVFEAIRSGASGFLVKDTEPDELLRAVRAVVGGDALLSPGVTRRLIAEFAARSKEPAAAESLARLTEREREVMALVGIGLSNDEIARRLVVSPLTAKTHVSRTMVKLGARDRAQLVVLAYESGLVRRGWWGCVPAARPKRTSTVTTRTAKSAVASRTPEVIRTFSTGSGRSKSSAGPDTAPSAKPAAKVALMSAYPISMVMASRCSCVRLPMERVCHDGVPGRQGAACRARRGEAPGRRRELRSPANRISRRSPPAPPRPAVRSPPVRTVRPRRSPAGVGSAARAA